MLTNCILLFAPSTSEYPLNVLYLFDRNGMPSNTAASSTDLVVHALDTQSEQTFDLKICPKFRHLCVTCVYVYMDTCNDMLLMSATPAVFISRSSTKVLAKSPIGSV